MPLQLNHRADFVTQADIRSMSIECDRVGGVNLAQGICDTPTPTLVIEAAAKAMRDGINSYTRFDGLAELREAIAYKVHRDSGVVVDPETQITVSAGSTGAFYCACLALLEPGDEVILFQPYYGYHVNTLVSIEAVPVYVPMQAPDWTFSREDLERVVTARTRGIMVCTPGNPSGKVFTKEEIEIIADFAKAHDIFVFTDEIYEYFLFGGRKHISPATLPEMAERTIVLGGYSKTFSITGWRIGYCISSPRWAQMIGYMNDLVYVCAPAPLQIGVAKGIMDLPMTFYTDLAQEYEAKRNLVCATLSQIGLTPSVPSGAYYVLADISKLSCADSREGAMQILRKTGVASVPGTSFFADATERNYVRFCFGKTTHDLDRACKALQKLNS